MLAKELGLTNKVVSERHYYASLHKLTAGEAAKDLSKVVGKKVSAKDIKELYTEQFGKEMEWHHSGFYKGKYGNTMGRTFFISKDELEIITKNFNSLNPSRIVYAYYWIWEKVSGKWCKILKSFCGKKTELPQNSTICDEFTYKVVVKREGTTYHGWEEPQDSDFKEDADKLRLKNYRNIFMYEHWAKVKWSRSKAFMGHTKSEFQIAANKHYKRQMMKSIIEQAKKKRETIESELKKIAKLPCIPDSDEIYNFFRVVSDNTGIIVRERHGSHFINDIKVVKFAKRRIRKYLSISENYNRYKNFYDKNVDSEFRHFENFEDYLKLLK